MVGPVTLLVPVLSQQDIIGAHAKPCHYAPCIQLYLIPPINKQSPPLPSLVVPIGAEGENNGRTSHSLRPVLHKTSWF